MTNEEIIRIATAQSAKDIGCEADDFFKEENVVVVFKLGQDAKKYYTEQFSGIQNLLNDLTKAENEVLKFKG